MKLRPFAALLLCFAASCGGGGSSDPKALIDEASKALHSGKYEDAAKSYESALAKLGNDPANPEWKHAKMGLFKARARIDATRAKDEFLEFARANPNKVTDSDFNEMGGKLGDAGKLQEAKAVLEAGMTAFPESPHLKVLLVALGKKAEESGDAAALKELEGLGYVGGD